MFVCGEPRRFVLDPSIQASPMNRDYLTFRIPFSLVAGTMSYVMPGITEHCIPTYLLKLLRIYFLFLLSSTSFFHPYHCFFNDTPNCFLHVIPLPPTSYCNSFRPLQPIITMHLLFPTLPSAASAKCNNFCCCLDFY